VVAAKDELVFFFLRRRIWASAFRCWSIFSFSSFSNDADADAADAEDFEVVDIRTEIFRIKDQFDELLDALDGKLFNEADLEKSCLLKKQM